MGYSCSPDHVLLYMRSLLPCVSNVLGSGVLVFLGIVCHYCLVVVLRGIFGSLSVPVSFQGCRVCCLCPIFVYGELPDELFKANKFVIDNE